MTNQISRIRVLLSSPGNLNSEREIAAQVVAEINLDRGAREDFYLELVTWETHTWPAAGNYAQDVINKQFPKEIDLYLGMMGAYFGTPTKKWGSGTEEEFRIAFEAWKKTGAPQLMFYFSDEVNSLSQIDPEQLLKRNAFKKEIGAIGLKYETYKDSTKLHVLLRRHLSKSIDEVLGSARKNKGPEISRGTSLNVLANFQELLLKDPMIAADELAAEAVKKLNAHTSSLQRMSKGVGDMGKTFQKSARKIDSLTKSQASQSKKLKIFQDEVSKIYNALSLYKELLKKEIPELESNFGLALTNFQRVIEIVRKENLEATMPLDSSIGPLNALRETYVDVKSQILIANVQMNETDFEVADLRLQQMALSALMNDLDAYFARSIELMEDVLDFYKC